MSMFVRVCTAAFACVLWLGGCEGPEIDLLPGGSGSGSSVPPANTVAATGGVAEPAVPAARPPCVDDPAEVVIVGDSYVSWISHTLPTDLAVVSGQPWRLYAIGGSSLGSGGLTGFIPDQFELAVLADPDIKVLLMDGGGNDILIPAATFLGAADCKNSRNSPNLQVCKDIVEAAVQASIKLMNRAADVGVKDTVYFFYPHVPEGTVLGGRNPNAILDYALPIARQTCEEALMRTNGRMRCHFVDMIPAFAGRSGLFASGDIHPNTRGSAVMAETIWDVMVKNCVAQPSSSGCCEPSRPPATATTPPATATTPPATATTPPATATTPPATATTPMATATTPTATATTPTATATTPTAD